MRSGGFIETFQMLHFETKLKSSENYGHFKMFFEILIVICSLMSSSRSRKNLTERETKLSRLGHATNYRSENSVNNNSVKTVIPLKYYFYL